MTRRLRAALLVAVALTLSACTSSTSGTARQITPSGASTQSSGPTAPSVSMQPNPNDAYRRPEAPAVLEHGAVWITYNAATLPADQVATLQRMVAGVDHLALSLTRI